VRRATAAASLLVLASLLWGSATPARACSVDEDAPPEDPLDKVHLVVGGRVVGWEPTGDTYLPFGLGTPIEMTLLVEESYKRSATGNIAVIESISLNPEPTERTGRWGIETTCGIGGLRADPTGSYVVVGLDYENDLRDLPERYSDRLFIERYLFVGNEPEGPVYEYAIAQVRRVDAPIIPLALAAVALPLVFVLAACFLFPAPGVADVNLAAVWLVEGAVGMAALYGRRPDR
jgi:hypothetical protein